MTTTDADGPPQKQAKKKAGPPTRQRRWTVDQLRELAAAAPSERARRQIDAGYLPLNREALHSLLALQSRQAHPTHAEASLLLRLLALSAWQIGQEGLVVGNQSEVSRLVESRTLRPFQRAVESLSEQGLLDVLKVGDRVVGYQIRADVYDWLTHPSRPPVPGRLGGPFRTSGRHGDDDEDDGA